MKLNFRATKEKLIGVSKGKLTMVVTGVCSDEKKKELEQALEAKGVKAVVTSEPVLGVFDLE